MQKLAEAPALSLRGNIVQRPRLLPSAEVVGRHLAHWQDVAANLDPQEISMQARAARLLVGRLADLQRLHMEYRLSGLGIGNPFTAEDMAEFQLRGSAAVGASVLLNTGTVQEYLRGSAVANPDEPAPVCFDPGGRDLRWHAGPGGESDLIDGYVPSDESEEWYEGDGIYLHVRRPAAPTPAFEESYRDYFGDDFDPAEFATVTPVVTAASMRPVAEMAITRIAIFSSLPAGEARAQGA